VQIRQYVVATLGAQQAFNVDANQFARLGNGTHTMTVTATDNWGASVTRTWTFTREENQIDVMLESSMAASAKPGRILVNINRLIQEGATFQVLACNNAYDASPVWEDATEAVPSLILESHTVTM
jgi:hypothetical protein